MRSILYVVAILLFVLAVAGGSAAAQTLSVFAAASPLNGPSSIVADASGNIFVVNALGPGGISPTVIKITPGGSVTTVFTVPASEGFTQLLGLAIDASGNLFVVNTNHDSIFRVTPAGAVSTFVAPNQGLSGPVGVAVDAGGNLFVANFFTCTISKVTPAGVVSTFVDASQGLSGPFGLAFDAGGNLFVANAGTDIISKVTPAGVVSTFVDANQGIISPQSLAFDATGNLIVGGGLTIYQITPGGVVTVIDHGHFFEPNVTVMAGGDLLVADGPANSLSRVAPGDVVTPLLQGTLAHPGFSAFDAAGNLYVPDLESKRIDKFTPAGVASTFVDATQGLSGPEALAFDVSGNLFIANGNSISKVTPTGVVSTFVDSTAGLNAPNGIAFDKAGNLFVANGGGNSGNSTISKVTTDGTVSTFVGPGQGLNVPAGLAFDADGNLFVANTGTGTISKVTPAGVVSTFVEASQNLFPVGLAFDASGNLLVSSASQAIFAVTPAGAVSVLAQSTPDATTPQFGFGNLSIALNAAGQIFVMDAFFNTVFRVAVTPSPLAAAILPGSRSVEVGATATVFATLLNTSDAPLSNCGAELSPLAPGSLSLNFQTTDPATNALTGIANQPVTIPAGGAQSFLLSLQATAPLTEPALAPVFFCQNVTPAPLTPGVDTLDINFSATPVPDIIALAATQTHDGIAQIAGGAGAFAIAALNLGVTGAITVTADSGAAMLPVTVTLCQTASTGQCLASPTASLPVDFAAGATPTFSVFVTTTGTIPFAPATARVFVRFTDASGVLRGLTSVAVETE